MKRLFIMSLTFVFSAAVFLPACGGNDYSEENEVTKARIEAQTIETAKEAYTFGFPLVLSELTKRYMTNPRPGTNFKPVNQIMHNAALPSENFNYFFKPDRETYYSFAWLDLAKEPLVFEIPDAGNLFTGFSLFDAWTNVFAQHDGAKDGKAGKFIVTGPRWNEPVPAGMTQYKAPTSTVLFVYRIRTSSERGASDNIKKHQQEINLYPLSADPKTYAASKGRVDETISQNAPAAQIFNMSIPEFFSTMNELMINNAPDSADAAVMDRILDIGVAPGMRFEFGMFSYEVQEAMKKIPSEIKQAAPADNGEKKDNGWIKFPLKKNYGTDYVSRANSQFDSLDLKLHKNMLFMLLNADNNEAVLDGTQNTYVLHFDKNEIPGNSTFWNIAVYNKDGFFEKNSVNRFAVGYRSSLKTNADGSLDIYIQNRTPGKDKESNWLPAPSKEFVVVFRCYLSDDDMLNKNIVLPGINRTK